MTCQDFNDRLPDYLDKTLDAVARAETEGHLEGCRDCQIALRRMQALSRALQGAFERETAQLTLAPETRAAILRAAEPAPPSEAAGRGAWGRWWPWRPARAFAGVATLATLAAALLVTVQWQRQRGEPRDARSTWSIEVPFQSDGQAGVIHADFSEP